MSAQSIVSLLYQRGATLVVEGDDLLIDAPDDVLDAILTDEVVSLVRQHKADIIALLKSLDAGMPATAAPVRHEYPDAYESVASAAQQRMLFMEELAGQSSYYNIPTAYRINGPLDKAALIQSFARLVSRHDVLRSVYVQQEHAYIQRVCAPAALAVIEIDLSTEADQAVRLEVLLRQEASHAFDLAREWPIRVSLIALGNDRHILSINIHHIAADGWSARKIISDIGAGYAMFLDASEFASTADSERNFQYADYVVWQEAWRQSTAYQEAKDYWIKTLKGMPQLHSLLTDYTRPSVQAVAGSTHTHTIGPSLSSTLEQGARNYRTTPFVIFQSVFAALLARYSGEEDIVFGTAAANRQPIEFVDTVGLFVNTLALRYAVTDKLCFSDLVKQAIEVSDGAFKHQQTPFDVLVDELQPARSLGYNPLVQVMLVMQENAAGALALRGTETVQLEQKQDVSKFDIALHVYASKGAIRLDWEYNTSLFKPETIQAMAVHFERLLNACLTTPEQAIGSIDLVDANHELQAMDGKQFPEPVCIHRLFEAQAILRPEAVAVRDGQHGISYRELDSRAGRVAAHLHRAGGGKTARIGLCMEKSVDLIVGLLAILKIGAVYVPLDPYYPKERLEFMMQDSGMEILLTSSSTKLPQGLEAAATLLLVDALDDLDASLHPAVTDVNLSAYIIYTSGSTGKPKGVLVSHKALFYSLHANRALMEMNIGDSMPTIGSQAFGVSLLEILLPLTCGGTVQMLNKAHIADLDKLMDETDQVTVLHAVPSLMQQWLDAVIVSDREDRYPHLRLLLVGGEPVPDGLLKKIKQWRPGVRLLELYGMTESAVVCSSYEVDGRTSAHYCIGKPHPNAHFHVLNRECREQPVGVPGELHIGGLSIATEYVNQPEMTAEKFIDSPLAGGERLYKTGDRVRLLHDGNFEFLGRVDHQVSLRGARIELGEIEMLAGSVAGVKKAVAHVADLGEDEKTLVLYYIADAGHTDQEHLPDIIRSCFVRQLPDYMRPSIIQRLDAFPLNPNGKVDRKNLPQVQFAEAFVAPETAIEQRLALLWQSILQRDAVGVTSDFFEMGGHSLMATKLATRIKAEFAVSIPLAVMFASPNIRACAAFIEKALEEKYAASLIQSDSEQDALLGDELII